ncbi:ATP-binding protein [Streptomyces sp. NPDC057654]|uniref:ATP-binding protein n=1 Tax=Streptomyces sp. NPDC057654 TaxID=3346196 RepID=UPI00368DE552
MSPTTAEIHDRRLGELVGRLEVDLAGQTTPQSVARKKVRNALVGRGGPEEVDDAVLVADELVGNALQHTAGPVSLALGLYEHGASVEVADLGQDITAIPAGPLSPPTAPDSVREGGRGMFLVTVLATDWTVRRVGDGKVVVAIFVLSGGDC